MFERLSIILVIITHHRSDSMNVLPPKTRHLCTCSLGGITPSVDNNQKCSWYTRHLKLSWRFRTLSTVSAKSSTSVYNLYNVYKLYIIFCVYDYRSLFKMFTNVGQVGHRWTRCYLQYHSFQLGPINIKLSNNFCKVNQSSCCFLSRSWHPWSSCRLSMRSHVRLLR